MHLVFGDCELIMTAKELEAVFVSSEFRQGLEEMSSYLASIMQERPIVYLTAKCLWRLGYKFELEDKRHDLSLNGKRVEFKFEFTWSQTILAKDLAKYGDNLKGMWELARMKRISKSWGVLAKMYEDACVRKPNIFMDHRVF